MNNPEMMMTHNMDLLGMLFKGRENIPEEIMLIMTEANPENFREIQSVPGETPDDLSGLWEIEDPDEFDNKVGDLLHNTNFSSDVRTKIILALMERL